MAKIELFQFCIEFFATTLWVKNSVEIALSLTVSEILIFFVFRKNSRWPPKVAKIEIFNFVQNTFLLPCESKILSKLLYLLRFVGKILFKTEKFQIFATFGGHLEFLQKSRWPPKVAKIENFQFC